MPSYPRWLTLPILTQRGSKPPYLLKYRSSNAFIIFTVTLAVFTDLFLYGMIVPVIPFSLETKSHVASDRVQYWVSILVAVYGAALLAFSPVCGWLADQTSSRRSSLLLGLLALLGATVMLNVGSSIAILIVARILQGSSAAVVWVVGLALLVDTVPPENLGEAMGYVTMGMSLGILISPLLGGVVFERAGYTAVYGMAYAIIGLDILLRLALVEKKVAARWAPQEEPAQGVEEKDIEGSPQNLDDKTTETIQHDAEKGTEATSRSPDSMTEHHPKTPLRYRVPPILSLLLSRRLLSALLGALMLACLTTSFDSVLALHAARTFHWNSTGAGLLFLPIVLPTFLAPLIGYLTDRFGARYPTAVGFLLTAPPYICLRYVTENTIRDKVLLCALLALIGLFVTFTFPGIMAEISKVVEAKEEKMRQHGQKGWGKGGAYAQAYALFNMAYAGGCLVGPLLAGFVVEEHGWGTMAWVLGLLSAATAVPTLLWMEGWIGEGSRKEEV